MVSAGSCSVEAIVTCCTEWAGPSSISFPIGREFDEIFQRGVVYFVLECPRQLAVQIIQNSVHKLAFDYLVTGHGFQIWEPDFCKLTKASHEFAYRFPTLKFSVVKFTLNLCFIPSVKLFTEFCFNLVRSFLSSSGIALTTSATLPFKHVQIMAAALLALPSASITASNQSSQSFKEVPSSPVKYSSFFAIAATAATNVTPTTESLLV